MKKRITTQRLLFQLLAVPVYIAFFLMAAQVIPLTYSVIGGLFLIEASAMLAFTLTNFLSVSSPDTGSKDSQDKECVLSTGDPLSSPRVASAMPSSNNEGYGTSFSPFKSGGYASSRVESKD